MDVDISKERHNAIIVQIEVCEKEDNINGVLIVVAHRQLYHTYVFEREMELVIVICANLHI